MTCEYREPPEETRCYCTATHEVTVLVPSVRVLRVCNDHALQLREQGLFVRVIRG